MKTRRDFIAQTACAIAAGAGLPVTAKAEPDSTARTDFQRQILAVFRQMGEREQIAFLNGMRRHTEGMPMLEAVRGVYVELGRPVPDNLLVRT